MSTRGLIAEQRTNMEARGNDDTPNAKWSELALTARHKIHKGILSPRFSRSYSRVSQLSYSSSYTYSKA